MTARYKYELKGHTGGEEMITCQICHAFAYRRQCGILPPGWRIAEYREGGFSDFGIICSECDRKMKTINNNRGNNMSSKGEREFPALKPCPFCKRPVIMHEDLKGNFVWCHTPGCWLNIQNVGASHRYSNKADCARAWNRRAKE